MTLANAMSLTDRQVINEIPAADKIRWLSQLDWTLYRTVLQAHVIPGLPEYAGYDENTPADTLLLADPPFDEIYRWYLEMQIHGVNAEAARYNAAAAKYNCALIAYMDYVNRTYPPAPRGAMRWW